MHPSLDRAFGTLEARKAAMLARVAAWPDDRQRLCPLPGQWCALEVLDHLRRTEAEITLSIRGNRDAPCPVPLLDRLRGVLLTGLFLVPSRVEVPAAASTVLPDRAPELPAICSQWSSARVALRELLSDYPVTSLAGGVFRHPVSGWMSLPRTLRFFVAHFTHHSYQLDRIERRV